MEGVSSKLDEDKRSADSAIRGYSYQFLHTIAHILEQEDDFENIIEGIEDLDVYSSEGNNLYQYKYHEYQNITNSIIGKPVGIMFNHFLNNENNKFNYKLIIYTQDNKDFIVNSIILKKILNTAAAKKVIEEENFKKIETKTSAFLELFSLVKAKEFSTLEQEVTEKIISITDISEAESKYGVLPNALKVINKLSMEKDKKNRIITCKEFKEKIFFEKHMIDVSFVERIKGEEKALIEFRSELKANNIDPTSNEYVVVLTNTRDRNSTTLIYDIAKKFYYDGNKINMYPVTFIINNNAEELNKIKIDLLDIMKNNNEKLIFNDGYEGYSFSPSVFNMKPFSTTSPKNGKVNNANFNFKIISLDTYSKNEVEIQLNSPVFFYMSYFDKLINSKYVKKFYIGNFKKEKILSLMGGNYGQK